MKSCISQPELLENGNVRTLSSLEEFAYVYTFLKLLIHEEEKLSLTVID